MDGRCPPAPLLSASRHAGISIRITNVLGINSVNSNAGCAPAAGARCRVNCESETQGIPLDRPQPEGRGEGRAVCLACLTLGLRTMATRANWVMKEWATRDRETAGRSALLPASSRAGPKVGLESQLYRVLFCLRTSVPRASVLGIVLGALALASLQLCRYAVGSQGARRPCHVSRQDMNTSSLSASQRHYARST